MSSVSANNYSPNPSNWFVENLETKYELLEFIGQGSFGTVRKVLPREENSNTNCPSLTQKIHAIFQPRKPYYAVKTIPKSKVEGDMSLLKKEVSSLELVKGHARLLQIQEVYEDEGNIHIITELLTGGELYYKILQLKENNKYFDNDDAAYIIRNILDGISYCHDVVGIVHRDLKVSNFMFEHGSYGHYVRDVKIIDFGLSTKIDSNGFVSGCCGNAYYVAPEVLLDDIYTCKVDIWSVGVIAYLVLSLTLPYQGKDEEETVSILQNVDDHKPTYSTKRWQMVEEEAVDFCKLLMQKDPSARPTAREAMNHPWIVKYCGKADKYAHDENHHKGYLQKLSFWLFSHHI